MKNAIDYSPKGKKIKIWIEEDADIFTIIIKDHGIGIEKDDLEHIFDRFYRVDRSRSRSSGGTGLGLSIVKMILDIHGFDISYESQIQKGTLVKIVLKKF
jgi:signal transduction histidine kinase